ncbi:MAG: DCC1-like thiol-disulfide oxidoreductase family protein [Actinobacteria bacterium]|nr:DCC1-like thiol-disulfide oxidoreductase family protein [Actinomycetota bacterium]
MITVIYDGQCRFCRACLAWLEIKLEVTTLAYQEIDTTRFGLTKAQCSEQVHIENQGQVAAGAAAVATLLNARGNTKLANLIFWSGPLGRIGYRWVASHRNSWIIKSATNILERKIKRV